MGVIEEFHDGALTVVGSCVAGRAWRAWPDGALTGVTYGQVWETTRNTAHCPYIGAEDTVPVPDGWRTGYPFHPRGRSAKTAAHTPGAIGCSCGWWCYHEIDMAPTWLPGQGGALGLIGVVQVYGLMTRGSKGYRAQHADIAALVRPSWSRLAGEDDDAPASVWGRVAKRYAVPVHESIEAAMAAIHGRAAA